MSLHEDKPREACGVVGVLTAALPAPVLARRGLVELQHRGQESAGIAATVTSSGAHGLLRGAGLVRDALPEPEVQSMAGDLAVGHVRYSTSGTRSAKGAQPIVRSGPGLWLAVAHNGNLVGCEELAGSAGLAPDAERTDSELLAELVGIHAGGMPASTPTHVATEAALLAVLPRLVGAYSLVLSEGSRVYGVRDLNGLRPLCLGRLPDGWALASETPALEAMGARFVREVEPGEVVVLEGETVRSLWPFAVTSARLCMFEFVYFARPDGRLRGQSVGAARRRAGAALADLAPLPPSPGRPEPAVVVPVPSSAVAAAQGYAARSGIPYAEGFTRNRAVGRTFLAPAQSEREARVRAKLAVVPDAVRGRRVVVVDDSLVRGTTTRTVVRMLREAGAAEVHLRIASPPWRWACHFGIDAGDPADLAAAVSTLSELTDALGSDSLAYLPLEDVLAATGLRADQFCTGCVTGRYPVAVPEPAEPEHHELFIHSTTALPDRRGALA